MGKQQGRGFVLHGFPWGCYNCCCRVCTGRNCPEHNRVYGFYRYHCAECVKSNGEMHIVLDCDFFENKHTSRRRFKVKRRWHKDDAIISRLDLIMKKLDVPEDGNSSNGSKHNYLDAKTIKLIEDYNKKE